MGNWVKISRDLRKHWIFSDAEYLKWWFDIICEAAWEDTKQLVGSRLVELKRGQFIASLSYLCERWHRSRSKVEPFLKMLIEDGMITKSVSHNISIVTVVNYNQYQDNADAHLCASLNDCVSEDSDNNSGQSDADLCAYPRAYLKSAKVQKADAYLCTNLSQLKSDTCIGESQQTDADLCAYLCAYPRATINKEDKEVKKDIINKKQAKSDDVKFSKLEEAFEVFRKAYPGRKRGHDTEFDAFKRKHKNWTKIVPLLMPALQRLIEYKKAAEAVGQWTASYANLSTWLYQARWEEELPEIVSAKQKIEEAQQPKAVCNYDDDEDAAFVSKNK